MYVISELHRYGVQKLPATERRQWGNTIAQTINELLYYSQKCDDYEVLNEVKEFVNNNLFLLEYLYHSGRNNKIMSILSRIAFRKLWMIYRILYKLRYWNSLDGHLIYYK